MPFAWNAASPASVESSATDASFAAPPAAPECTAPPAAWLWCDDFEEDRLGRYFEHDSADGGFVRVAGVGVDGSAGMRARFRAGQISAGSLHLAFGRTPQRYFRPVDEGRRDYREVWWRFYLRHQPGWQGGGGDKLTRATVFASSTSWAQAMIAHVWSGSRPHQDLLVADPASGTDPSGRVVTTRYNDFPRLRWLGAMRGSLPIFGPAGVGKWYCIEAHVALNTPGRSDGVFEFWVDGLAQGSRRDLNWVGGFDAYGINAIFLENYWNRGAVRAQERYFDRFVVSTERVGC